MARSPYLVRPSGLPGEPGLPGPCLARAGLPGPYLVRPSGLPGPGYPCLPGAPMVRSRGIQGLPWRFWRDGRGYLVPACREPRSLVPASRVTSFLSPWSVRPGLPCHWRAIVVRSQCSLVEKDIG